MAKGKKTGGRKKSSLNKSTLEIKSIIDKCVDFNEVVNKLYELTQGIKVQKKIDGTPIIYEKEPDSNASKILLEYRFGKPKQSIEHSGEITEVNINKTIITRPDNPSLSIDKNDD